MSKRFGRNQKRKLAAAVTLAEARQKRAEDTAKQCIEYGEQARKIIKMVYRMNPNSVALDRASILTEDTHQIMANNVVDSTYVSVGGGSQAPRMIDTRAINLYHLSSELVDNRPFTDAVHFKVRLHNNYAGDIHYGYAATIEAMKARPEIIADEISRLLKRELQAH